MYTFTIDEFEEILKEEGLAEDALFLMITILCEIKEYALTFEANSHDLVNKASEYSVTYNRLPDERKESLDGIMNMPIFICYGPDDDGDSRGVSYPTE
jgi:hypothetical protein